MRKLVLSWLFVSSCMASAVLAAPQTGWWWNPAESGRGFFVESRDGITFIGAYLYESDGHATWLVAGSPNADPYNFTGDLYNLSNGQTLYGNYVVPGPTNTVGKLTAQFTDDTHGTITWPGGTVAVERQMFDNTKAAFQPHSGWWWNPAEGGSGYSVEVQGKNIFIVGFMYDDAGRAVWYFSAGPMSSDNTFSSAVLQFAGGQTMTGPYRPPATPVTIATLDVVFKAEDAAEFTFTESVPATQGTPREKAAKTSTKKLQPQFPKPSFYLPPPRFAGSLTQDLKSHSVSSTVTADGHAFEDLGIGWDKDLAGPKYDFYKVGNGNMSISYAASSKVVVPGGSATCNNSGAITVPLGSGISTSSLRVGSDWSYLLYVHLDEGAASVPTTGQCQADDLVTPFNPTVPSALVDFNYEGVVAGDAIRGGGVKTIIDGPVTTTWTYSWNFIAIRPPPP